jgi:hypothetical protein
MVGKGGLPPLVACLSSGQATLPDHEIMTNPLKIFIRSRCGTASGSDRMLHIKLR